MCGAGGRARRCGVQRTFGYADYFGTASLLNVFNLRYVAPAALTDGLAGQDWFTALQACRVPPTDLVAQASADSFELFLGNVVYAGTADGRSAAACTLPPLSRSAGLSQGC
jgi:hypothetical protein